MSHEVSGSSDVVEGPPLISFEDAQSEVEKIWEMLAQVESYIMVGPSERRRRHEEVTALHSRLQAFARTSDGHPKRTEIICLYQEVKLLKNNFDHSDINSLDRKVRTWKLRREQLLVVA